MLKTVFAETEIHFIQDSLMNKVYVLKCNILNVFTVTFDEFDASLLNKY